MIDLSKAIRKTDEEYFPLLKDIEYTNLIKDIENNISYKDAINLSMKELGDAGAIFIGYNVLRGDAMGTLKGIDDSQKLETPVAENLMTGLAIGMSFENFLPVIYFERHDFMLVALDAIGNHIDKIERISHGEYKVPIIIRAVTADGGPFYSGPTHSQDFTNVLKELVSFPVIDPTLGKEALNAFRNAKQSGRPAIIIERKSRY
jgi:pyruvate dehydrogenase E1 component beta subunit